MSKKNNRREKFVSFEEAREWARGLKIDSTLAYKRIEDSEIPKNIPSNPREFYKDEWQGWDDFLGIEERLAASYVTYEEASYWAKKHRITNSQEWQNAQRPDNIPELPIKVYRKQWKGWKKFLNNENIKKEKIDKVTLDLLYALMESAAIAAKIKTENFTITSDITENTLIGAELENLCYLIFLHTPNQQTLAFTILDALHCLAERKHTLPIVFFTPEVGEYFIKAFKYWREKIKTNRDLYLITPDRFVDFFQIASFRIPI